MHKCVRCGKAYESSSKELLMGCPCGARVFVFLKNPDAQGGEEGVEEDYRWLEQELSFLSKDRPVTIEKDAAENLKIIEKGSYEIDVKSLMGGNPLVIKSEKGIYYIKIPSLKK
ncbi:MAG: Zn-ribbon containing protein [Candidatus Micrarchaeota archaeon]